jgi:OOP family OmpA-OmpF porin
VSPIIGGYSFDSEEDIEEGPVFGVGFGYNFTENWGARVYGHYGEFTHHYWDCDLCRCAEEDVDATVFQANLVYHLWPERQWVPYVAAGFGYVDVDSDNTDIDSSGMLSYGGGIKYFLNPNMAVKATVRHLYQMEDSRSNMMAGVGLEFQFGGEKSPVVPETVPEPEPPVEQAPPPAPPEPKPEPEPEPKVVQPVPVPPHLSFALKIKFGFNSSKIEAKYHDEIRRAVQFLEEHPGVEVVIEGHTCSIGSETYNMALSKKRAESVKSYMVDIFNMDGSKLSTIGYGEARPEHDNATEEGRQLNRRVMIRLAK